MKLVAGIVTYNPEIDRLKINIEAICPQVDEVMIFDNHSDNIEELKAALSAYPSVVLVKSNDNIGIAAAFNHIINYCFLKDIRWVLLLDQDSVCPENLISRYLSYISDPKIAVIAPLVIDRRRARRKTDYQNDTQEIKKCISSGSFVNVEICRRLGLFESQLFIDVVDYEYCMRVRLHQYKILQVNNLILDQEFGNVIVKKHSEVFKKISRITKLNVFEHFAYAPVYAPRRVFYIIRNWIYCIRKYWSYSKPVKEILILIKESFVIIIRGAFRLRLISSIFQGIKAGLAMEVTPVEMQERDIRIDLM